MKRIKIRAKLKIFFGDIYFCEEADKVLGGCLRATANTKRHQRRARPPNIHKKVVCSVASVCLLALPGGTQVLTLDRAITPGRDVKTFSI
jgi:hypothetical protein